MKEYKTYEAAKKRLEEIALKLEDKNTKRVQSLLRFVMINLMRRS